MVERRLCDNFAEFRPAEGLFSIICVKRSSIRQKNIGGICAQFYDENDHYKGAARPYFQQGDVLYVRETWGTYTPDPERCYPTLYFKASDSDPPYGIKWQSPLTMPRNHSRLFLRIKSVRVERLNDITARGLQTEGIIPNGLLSTLCGCKNRYLYKYQTLWDSKIKLQDLALYGWYANPWVWVFEFEMIEKEEAKTMRPIDADKITSDSEFVKATVGLFKSCKMKHREGCWAPTCEECFARVFNSFNLLPFFEELSCETRMDEEVKNATDRR